MQQLNKELKYGGYTFNIGIELLTNIEKRMGGKREHTVTVNDMGATNYYQKYTINDANLDQEIETIFEKTKQWADSKSNDDQTTRTLKKMGFK